MPTHIQTHVLKCTYLQKSVFMCAHIHEAHVQICTCQQIPMFTYVHTCTPCPMLGKEEVGVKHRSPLPSAESAQTPVKCHGHTQHEGRGKPDHHAYSSASATSDHSLTFSPSCLLKKMSRRVKLMKSCLSKPTRRVRCILDGALTLEPTI